MNKPNHEEKIKKLIDELYLKNILHDPLISEALEKVSMYNYFPREIWDYLYQDIPLPYCFNPQRPCAAPHMNAIFLHLINLIPECKIVQLSSMSGYFASLMAEISKNSQIIIIEDNKIIAELTKENIKRSKLDNRIKVINNDPVDEIFNHIDADRFIFCGAISNSFLSELAEQVKDDTVILAPVFNSVLFPIDQDLIRIIKEDGELITESFGKVNFILLESEKILNWTKKTQKLIFNQIADQLQDYFQETYPTQEPIFKLSMKIPEFISKDLLDTTNLLSRGYYKQVLLNCLEILNETIRYIYKNKIDKNVDFSSITIDEMIEKLKNENIINRYNSVNLYNVLDIREILIYDPDNPPNFENIAKTSLNHLIWFIESLFT